MNGKEKTFEVYTFDQVQTKNLLGNSDQSKYLYRYLKVSNARTCVFEEEYIDKDYLIDYSKFYARSFRRHSKFTSRLHFFSENFSNEEFKNALVNFDKKNSQKLQDYYLGFVVVKPITNSLGDPLIGRTILKTYPNDIDDGKEHRIYITQTYKVSLFGIPLEIESLPFQTQDTAVGACATTAVWIALHPLNALFGSQKDSPFEVTEKSVSFPSLEERNFPNSGLTLLQMKSYFNSIQLETEFIDLNKIQTLINYTSADDVVADAVKAYTSLKLPIIASLILIEDKKKLLGLIKNETVAGYHAVVITGYRCNKNGNLNGLYVHDDQIGAYSKVTPVGNFAQWKNEWTENKGMSKVLVYKLMVPIYPKIRLSFNSIYQIFLMKKRKLESRTEGLTPELFLTDVNRYKKFLWEHSIEEKERILSKNFPKFLWIIRLHFRGIPIIDYVYDGTSVYPKESEESITFQFDAKN
jgi:hypothetical protein